MRNMPGGMGFAARDFALVTLAAELSVSFPGQQASPTSSFHGSGRSCPDPTSECTNESSSTRQYPT